MRHWFVSMPGIIWTLQLLLSLAVVLTGYRLHALQADRPSGGRRLPGIASPATAVCFMFGVAARALQSCFRPRGAFGPMPTAELVCALAFLVFFGVVLVGIMAAIRNCSPGRSKSAA